MSRKGELERKAVAWFSKKKEALIVNFFEVDDGKVGKNLDDDARFVIFTRDLDDLREGRYRGRSVPVYKSRPFVPREGS